MYQWTWITTSYWNVLRYPKVSLPVVEVDLFRTLWRVTSRIRTLNLNSRSRNRTVVLRHVTLNPFSFCRTHWPYSLWTLHFLFTPICPKTPRLIPYSIELGLLEIREQSLPRNLDDQRLLWMEDTGIPLPTLYYTQWDPSVRTGVFLMSTYDHRGRQKCLPSQITNKRTKVSV